MKYPSYATVDSTSLFNNQKDEHNSNNELEGEKYNHKIITFLVSVEIRSHPLAKN